MIRQFTRSLLWSSCRPGRQPTLEVEVVSYTNRIGVAVVGIEHGILVFAVSQVGTPDLGYVVLFLCHDAARKQEKQGKEEGLFHFFLVVFE